MPKLRFSMPRTCGGALRSLSLLPAVEDGNHAAELAAERAADAGMMDACASAQKGRQQIPLQRAEAVIGQYGKIVGRAEGALGVMDVEAERVLEGEPANVRETPRASKSLEQFDDGLFALPANDEIHVAGVERGVRVEGRKVAAPNDGHLRMFLAGTPGRAGWPRPSAGRA